MSAPPDNWDDDLEHHPDDTTDRDRPMPHAALDCCAICLDPRDRPDDMALLLPCRHRCDADCIEQWRARQADLPATCPLCRSWIQRVVVGNEAPALGAKLAADGVGDNCEWAADDDANGAPLQVASPAANVVVIDIAPERRQPAARAHGRRRQRGARRDQFFTYIDHEDDDRYDDQLSKWCAVEDAMLDRAREANDRRRREKNWMERDEPSQRAIENAKVERALRSIECRR